MNRKSIAFLAAAFVAIALPISVNAKAPSMAELLPPESLGYVEVSDMGVFYYLVSEIGGAAVRSLEEEPDIPGDIKVKAKAVLAAFDEIKPLLPKSAALGLVSIDPQRGQPSLVLTAELSESLAILSSAAGKLLMAAPNVKITETEFGNEVLIPDTPLPPIGYAVKDNVLYVTAGEGLLGRVLSRAGPERLSQTAQFKEVNVVTGKNAFVSVYLNVDAIRETLLPIIPPKAQQIVELLGLKDVHTAAFSLGADEKFVGSNLALLYTEGAPGIASFLSIPNTPPKGIAYVPQDFSYVRRFTIGQPAEVLKNVQSLLQKAGAGVNIDQALAGVKENMGVDVYKVLASLGGEITLGVKIPDTLALPNIVVCLDASDPQCVMDNLKSLFTALNVTSSEMEVSGKKVLMVTPGMPVPVSPAIAVDDGMIVIGISTAAVQKALTAKETGQNISTKPEFNAAMEGLPAGNNIGLEYVEIENLAQLGLMALSMASARAPAEAKPVIARAMQYANKAAQNLEPAVEATYRTPNGLAVQSRWGTRSLMQILTNGAAAAAKAVIMIKAASFRPPVEQAPAEAELTQPSEEVSEAGKVFIGLDAYATSGLQGLHGREGNDLPFKPGAYVLGGNPYRIGKGIVQVAGENLQDAPREVKGIRVGQKFKNLHILHATGWSVDDGTQVGCYVINYDDGSSVEIPLRYGGHLRDWWASQGPSEVSEAKVAWTGRNSQSPIRLYSLEWQNPHPDKVVAAIDCRSAGTNCAPFVVAVTADTQ